jgi:hypothetical protein
MAAKGIASGFCPSILSVNIWKDAKSFNITKIDDVETRQREDGKQMLAV